LEEQLLSKHAVSASPEMLSELSDAELSAHKARLQAGKARVEAELAKIKAELATFDVELAGVDAVEFVALHQRVLEEAPAASEVCTMPRPATQKQPTDRAKKRRSTKEEPCQSEQWIIPATEKEWSARLNSDDLFKVSRDKNCRMPSVLVTKSNYEDAGLGLFANEKISKGTKVTECGGEIICFQAAQELAKTKQDTHCLALEPRFLAIDGRVRNQFTKEWYCTHHKAGAFVNSAIDPKERNAKYQCCAGNLPYIQPYKNENSPDLRCSQKRIYIVATRDIQEGEEIVTHYRF
jgi:uncharacterized small protein (DUF1192 family)